MTKRFTRIEPTTVQEFGIKYKRQAVIKTFQTEDGLPHEFTTIYKEGSKSAAVIALTKDNKVITVFEFRPGSEQWVYEIPGGGVGEDEDPEVGAIRELKEETGYIPGEIEFLGKSYGDAYTNITFHYYLATNCMLDDSGTVLDQEEYDQGAEVHLMTIDEFIDKSKNGPMTDPKSVLLAYDKLKEIGSVK